MKQNNPQMFNSQERQKYGVYGKHDDLCSEKEPEWSKELRTLLGSDKELWILRITEEQADKIALLIKHGLI